MQLRPDHDVSKRSFLLQRKTATSVRIETAAFEVQLNASSVGGIPSPRNYRQSSQ